MDKACWNESVSIIEIFIKLRDSNCLDIQNTIWMVQDCQYQHQDHMGNVSTVIWDIAK